jgi:hypothetical protein
MKNKFVWLLIGLAGFLQSCGPSQKDAAAYNDSVVSLLDTVLKADYLFINSLESDTVVLQQNYNLLLSVCGYSQKQVNEIAAFNNEDSLKMAARKYLDTYKSICENEYLSMKRIVSQPQENISFEDDELFNQMLDSSEAKRLRITFDFEKAQNSFAHKYDFKIEAQKE